MRIINFVSKCLLTIGLITVATPVLAFPEKPIEFVIPFGAGGGADIEGRLLAQEMAKVLGVSVMPVNRKGGGGAIAYTHTRNAKPDGYTIAWNSTSVLTTTNLGNTDFAYDAMDHVGRVEFQPQPFAVKSSSKWKTFKDFVTDCKASPGTLKVANSGTGSATHTAAIALMNAAGCKVIHLPKGIKGRNKSVLNGEADKRNDIFPNVPTAKELGYNASLDLFRGLSVPPNTPDKIKSILADAMAKAANSDAFLALAKKKGFKVSPLGHKEFGELLSREDKKVKAIFASAGLLKNK